MANTAEEIAAPEAEAGDRPREQHPKSAAPKQTSKREVWLGRALLLILTFVTFLPALRHGLLPWDDAELITRNPHVHAPYGAGLATVWTQAYDGLYAPLFFTSYLAEVALTGGDETRLARLIHLDNLLLHGLVALAVFGLLRQLLASPGRSPRVALWAAWTGALLFSLHPLQAESVNWATGRKDLLAWLFGFLALRCYVEWRRKGTAVWYGAALGAFAVALLSKATTASIPLAAAALDFYLFRLLPKQSARSLWPWALMAVIFAKAASAIQLAAGGGVKEVLLPAWTRPFIAADSLAFYLGKMLFPTALSPVYLPVEMIAANRRLLFIALPLVTVVLALLLVRRNLLGGGAAVAVALLLPTSGIVPFHYQTISSVADRYAYGAMLGGALAAAAAVAWSAERRPRLTATVCVGVLMVLGGLSWRQSHYWRSSETLWSYAARVAPASAIVRNNLGMTYGELGRLDDAQKEFEAAVRLSPRFAGAHNNLANIYSARDRREEALEHYAKAVESEPRHVVARTNLMMLQFQGGRQEEAAAQARLVLENDPNHLMALNVLAINLGSQGKGEEALKLLRDASARKPGDNELKALLQQAEQIVASERR